MDIKIQSIHFDADKKLLDFIREKVSKLDAINDNIVGAEVILRLDKSSDTENKVGEIKLLVKGADLFVKKQCKSFEEAIDSGVEAMRKQVQKHKEKLRGI
jgi:putative sigma-54 modulation protein